MISSKKLIIGLLTAGTVLTFSCENKKGEQPKGEAKQETTQKVEETTGNKALSCTLSDELKKNIKESVKNVFKEGVQVGQIKNSFVPGMVEVEISSKDGKKGYVLFDCNGRYMLVGKVLKIGAAQAGETGGSEGGGCLEAGVSKDKVQSVLSHIFGGKIEVLEVNKTPMGSIFEVVVKDPTGRNEVIYMDCDLKNILLGTLIDAKGGKNLTAEKRKELLKDYYKEKEKKLVAKIGEKKFKELKNVLQNFVYQLEVIDMDKVSIPQKGVIEYGNPDAKYTIYIISDPQCPFCARLDETVKKIASERKDVKFKIFMYPLPFHQYAKGISENILCQQDAQKRKEILEKSFTALRQKKTEDLKNLQASCPEGQKILEEHKKFAKDVNLKGTPLIIFPNGIAVSGAVSKDVLNKMIDIMSKEN